MRIQETLAERTKDFSLAGSGAGYYDSGEDKTKIIRAQLDSGSDREKLEAMKRLIAVSGVVLTGPMRHLVNGAR